MITMEFPEKEKRTDEYAKTIREWLMEILSHNVATVTFIKADGTERVMECTLDPAVLPPAPVTEGKSARKRSDSTIAVYDVEANGWRSFTVTSVNKISFPKL